jgi:hypothetical protein
MLQSFPQLPQFSRSVLRFLQVPLQSVNPGGQTHLPPSQRFPPAHRFPQLPQFSESV